MTVRRNRDGELTGVKISEDSQDAIINHAPDVRPCPVSD
jgi:hypothetical protein